jgi:cytoskeletal protein RodZ
MFAKFKKKRTVISPQQYKQEKITEIGTYLSQIRTQKDISLKLIETKTRIPVRLLKAIETGDLSSLPEPIYIRGLIKQFAEALDLDGTQLANTFPIDLGLPKNSRFYLPLPSLQLRPFHLYLLYILVVVLSVRAIANVLKQSVTELTIETSPQPLVAASPVNQQSKPKVLTKIPTPKKPQTKPVMVDVELKDLSWLEIVVDGKSVFQGNLPKGTKRTWSANKQVTIVAGNAGGVLVTFNNEQPKSLGKLGQVTTVTYKSKPTTANSNLVTQVAGTVTE